MTKQYAISYLHYVLATRDTYEAAQEYAKEAESDRDVRNDKSQRGLIGPISDYITIYDATGEDL